MFKLKEVIPKKKKILFQTLSKWPSHLCFLTRINKRISKHFYLDPFLHSKFENLGHELVHFTSLLFWTNVQTVLHNKVVNYQICLHFVKLFFSTNLWVWETHCLPTVNTANIGGENTRRMTIRRVICQHFVPTEGSLCSQPYRTPFWRRKRYQGCKTFLLVHYGAHAIQRTS